MNHIETPKNMRIAYEVKTENAHTLLAKIRSKFKEAGYKCRKFTNSDKGFIARFEQNWYRVSLSYFGEGMRIDCFGFCSQDDPLHALGIEYMIESAIANQ